MFTIPTGMPYGLYGHSDSFSSGSAILLFLTSTYCACIQNPESDSYGVFCMSRDSTLHIQYRYLTADIVSPVALAF